MGFSGHWALSLWETRKKEQKIEFEEALHVMNEERNSHGKKEQNMCDDDPLAKREVSRDTEDTENINCYWCSRKYITEESMFNDT